MVRRGAGAAGTAHDRIDGIQQRNNKRWDVTLHPQSYETYSIIKRVHMGTEILLPTWKLVSIIDPQEVTTEVIVRKIPMFWSQHRVLNIFSKYGTVKNIKKERYRTTDADGTSFGGLWNGNLRISMVLKDRIPSGITISGISIEIFHRNQQPTCRTCGLVGHKFYECKTPRTERNNMFDIADFPDLPSRQQEAQNEQTSQSLRKPP